LFPLECASAALAAMQQNSSRVTGKANPEIPRL
jgi:hypothetical protein